MTYGASETVIWVLGARSPNADRSLDWYQVCPNLTNCDVLIVNLDSIRNLDPAKGRMNFYDARKYIFDLLMTGEKTAIFVLPTSMKEISSFLSQIMPVGPIFRTIAPCEFDKFNVEDLDEVIVEAFEDYLKTVKDCSYYIRSLDHEFFWGTIDPDSKWTTRETYDFTHRIQYFRTLEFSSILNRARQRIGMSFRIVIEDRNSTELFMTGFVHILPPPTEISVDEGIQVIVNHLIGLRLKEPPPTWEENMRIPGLDEVISKISQFNIDIKRIAEQRKSFEIERDRLMKFRRLLWTKGEKVLQEAVKNAFIELEFTEIRQERARNKEDWIFNFKSKPLIGVLEVTGADKRTSLKDLRKCADWVTDYDEKGRDCKGIFIPNQYRRQEYPKSKKKREHFEKNEIQFARKHNICILPSHIVFEVVVEKMKGNPRFNRESVEERILSADPVCKFDL